jgi:hypothetical protein
MKVLTRTEQLLVVERERARIARSLVAAAVLFALPVAVVVAITIVNGDSWREAELGLAAWAVVVVGLVGCGLLARAVTGPRARYELDRGSGELRVVPRRGPPVVHPLGSIVAVTIETMVLGRRGRVGRVVLRLRGGGAVHVPEELHGYSRPEDDAALIAGFLGLRAS